MKEKPIKNIFVNLFCMMLLKFEWEYNLYDEWRDLIIERGEIESWEMEEMEIIFTCESRIESCIDR